jgi:gas vesicle protein
MAQFSDDPVVGAGRTDDSAVDSDARRSDAPDPAAIRADIRDTRERVGDTLEQIGERLNPNHLKAQVREQVRENVTHLKDQVRDNLRDATIGRVEHMAQNAADRVNEARYSIADTIRENPIPAALVGIGLGWLFMNRSQGRGARDYGRYEGARYSYGGSLARPASGGYPYGAGESGYAGTGYAGTGAQEEGVVDRARERVGEIGHTVRDTAGQVVDRAQHAAETVADRAQHVASEVADRTRYQARRVEDRYYESPLAVGAATLALGLAAGLALPATEREAALMGDARDRLVDRAKEAAQGTAEKVQHVAERVVSEAKPVVTQAARDEGLTR